MHPLQENPFFILGLPKTATPMEVERQGKKLLGMLELQLVAAATYQTPWGPRERTPERVREAVQLLLDPGRRLPYEPWASWDPTTTATDSTSDVPTDAPAFDASGLVWWNP